MAHVIDLAQYRAQKRAREKKATERAHPQENSYCLLYKQNHSPNGETSFNITAVSCRDTIQRQGMLIQYSMRGWKSLFDEGQGGQAPRYPWNWSDPLGSLLLIIADMTGHRSLEYQRVGRALTSYRSHDMLHIVRLCI